MVVWSIKVNSVSHFLLEKHSCKNNSKSQMKYIETRIVFFGNIGILLVKLLRKNGVAMKGYVLDCYFSNHIHLCFDIGIDSAMLTQRV